MEYYARMRRHWDDDAVPVHADTSERALRAFADELLELIAPRGDERVLDVGCGDGLLAALLRPHVAVVDGIDIAETRVQNAARRLPDGEFSARSFLDPYPSGPYDVVCSWSVVQYCRPADLDVLFDRSLDASRPGGRVVHGDVIDRQRLAALYDEQGLKGRIAHLRARALPARPIWRDGSHAHDLVGLRSRLEAHDLEVELRAARCLYRTHVLVRRPTGR